MKLLLLTLTLSVIGSMRVEASGPTFPPPIDEDVTCNGSGCSSTWLTPPSK